MQLKQNVIQNYIEAENVPEIINVPLDKEIKVEILHHVNEIEMKLFETQIYTIKTTWIDLREYTVQRRYSDFELMYNSLLL